MRRRHPLMKALAGVVVLVAIAVGAGVAGVGVIQNMINENGKSRLELFTDGTDSPTWVTIGDPTARIRVALPASPQASHESMTFLGAVRAVDRRISKAGDASVQILWVRIPARLAENPEGALRLFAGTQANNLGGSNPLDAKPVSSGTTAVYEFRVHPQATVAGGSDYYVRILLHGDVVYVVRVEAKKGGHAALVKICESIAWQPASRAPA